MVEINLHGNLGEYIGSKKWNLNVSSVSEAISSLNILLNNKFNEYFIKTDKLQAKYRVLINGKDFHSPVKEINEQNIEFLHQTQLVYKIKDLQTIDIVPFIENYDSKTLGILTIIAGVVLVAVGLYTGNSGLIFAGLALAMGGVAALLARPPEFGNFRNIDKFGNQSYLFGGPTNIIGEGGPVPVGYGRMLMGSQVISSAYKITDFQTFRDSKT